MNEFNDQIYLKSFDGINKINSQKKLVAIGKSKESYVDKRFKMTNENIINNILHINQIENKYIYQLMKLNDNI